MPLKPKKTGRRHKKTPARNTNTNIRAPKTSVKHNADTKIPHRASSPLRSPPLTFTPPQTNYTNTNANTNRKSNTSSIIPYATLTQRLGHANNHLSLHATTVISASKINRKVRAALTALGLGGSETSWTSASHSTKSDVKADDDTFQKPQPPNKGDGEGKGEEEPSSTSKPIPTTVVTITARADAASKAISVAEIVKRCAAESFGTPTRASDMDEDGASREHDSTAAAKNKGKRNRRTALLYQYTMLHAVPPRPAAAPASAAAAAAATTDDEAAHPDAPASRGVKRKRNGDDSSQADLRGDGAGAPKAAKISDSGASPPHDAVAQDARGAASDPDDADDDDDDDNAFQRDLTPPPRPRDTPEQRPEQQPQPPPPPPPQRPTPALTIVLARTRLEGFRAACAEQVVHA